jgi:hypothetical protein
MKNITLTLLAAAAIGAISIGSASAMPFNSASPVFDQSDVQKVRLVCNSNGRCYNNTRRTYRSAPRYYAPGYYNGGYYGGPGYGYYGGPHVGVGIGPFGFGVW